MNQLNLLTFKTANYIADAGVFLLAFLLASMIDAHDEGLGSAATFGWSSALFIGLCFYGTNFFALAYFRAYATSRLRFYSESVLIYSKSSILAFLLSVLIDVFYPFVNSGYWQLPAASLIAFCILLLKEASIRYLLRRYRRNGLYLKRALLVAGKHDLFEKIRLECEDDPLIGLEMIGIVGAEGERGNLGALRDLGGLLDHHNIGTVICSADDLRQEEIGEVLRVCDERGVELLLKLGFLDQFHFRARVNSLAGASFLSLQIGPQVSSELFLKYVFDRILSAVLLLLVSPVLLILAILVRVTSPGPILFRQLRAGQDGRPFVCLKFRSMEVGAEAKQEQLVAFNEMQGPVFKMKNDPRVTKFGDFLRRTSLDELPQLWNVFRGEMSLVGPRPLPVQEARNLSAWHRRRFRMRPGITGPWQVSGRSTITDFNRWAELDLEYIDNWSLYLDLKLLLSTLLVVFSRRGAH